MKKRNIKSLSKLEKLLTHAAVSVDLLNDSKSTMKPQGSAPATSLTIRTAR